MKLNKVLALALSGVMAVSMLAGCSGNPGNGGQEGEGETNVTGFAATVASKLDENKDNVTVTSDNAIDTALKAAMVKIPDTSITPNRSSAALNVVGSGEPYTSLKDALGDDLTFSTTDSYTTGMKDDSDKKANATVIYWIGGDIDKNHVAQLVADKIDALKLPKNSDPEDDGKYYKYSYTANVSFDTATTKDGTASLYYIVVSLNQAVSEAKL